MFFFYDVNVRLAVFFPVCGARKVNEAIGLIKTKNKIVFGTRCIIIRLNIQILKSQAVIMIFFYVNNVFY